MDLNDIRTFVAVAETGTFRAAAQELQQPASTVSRAVTRLEARLGVTLCARSTSGAALTEAGAEYLPVCIRALRSLRKGRDLLEEHRSQPAGIIRVVCPVTLARDVLAPVLVHFLERHPALRVSVEPYCSNFDPEPHEGVDVFFKLRSPRDSSRRARPYPGTRRALFASAAYLKRYGTPVEPTNLTRHRCLGLNVWKLHKGDKNVTVEFEVRVSSSDPEVHLQLALTDAGIVVLPLWMAARPEAKAHLRRVLPDWSASSLTVCAIYSGGSRLPPKTRAFLDFMDEYFGTALDPRLRGLAPEECFELVQRPAKAAL